MDKLEDPMKRYEKEHQKRNFFRLCDDFRNFSSKAIFELETVDKIHRQLRPGANAIKPFAAVINEFSYLARAFVRLGLKSMPGTNTLAYYENS